MKAAITSLVLLLSISPAFAADLGQTPPVKAPPSGGGPYGGERVGGDTIDDAVLIGAIPYTDTGSTCGYNDDYNADCPAGGSAPDVVYQYLPTADAHLSIDLCASDYDTKLYVWEDAEGNVIACNDDWVCGPTYTQSLIIDVAVRAGHSYYVVVDGYGSNCGNYGLSISEIYWPCIVECPAGAQQEGEPPCVDGYEDSHNAGCGGLGGFTPIYAQDASCGTMCGRSCTFLYEGMNLRDTDWYTLLAAGGLVTATGIAEFPLQYILIYGIDCSYLLYIVATALPCEPATLEWTFPTNQEFWLWVGPIVFEGVPESDYVLDVCGLAQTHPLGACCISTDCTILTEAACTAVQGNWQGEDTSCEPNPCDATAIERTSWGRLKANFH